MNKLSYRTARKAVIKQAQQQAMVDVAKGKAKENIEQLFALPLRIAGRPDVKIAAQFE